MQQQSIKEEPEKQVNVHKTSTPPPHPLFLGIKLNDLIELVTQKKKMLNADSR